MFRLKKIQDGSARTNTLAAGKEKKNFILLWFSCRAWDMRFSEATDSSACVIRASSAIWAFVFDSAEAISSMWALERPWRARQAISKQRNSSHENKFRAYRRIKKIFPHRSFRMLCVEPNFAPPEICFVSFLSLRRNMNKKAAINGSTKKEEELSTRSLRNGSEAGCAAFRVLCFTHNVHVLLQHDTVINRDDRHNTPHWYMQIRRGQRTGRVINTNSHVDVNKKKATQSETVSRALSLAGRFSSSRAKIERNSLCARFLFCIFFCEFFSRPREPPSVCGWKTNMAFLLGEGSKTK